MFDVEHIIKAAIRRGELDNLPGQGKPLKLDDDSGVPPEERMAFRILKNSGFLPPELAGKAELAKMREALKAETDEVRRKALQTRISTMECVINLRMERFRR